MATTVSLERLVHAIVGSVIQAQHLVETAQLSHLRAYFNKDDDKPITLDIKLPSLQGNPGEFDTYVVPVVSLVSHGSLVINEASLKMDVELGGVQQDAREGPYPTVAELARGQDRPVMPKLLIDPESGGISKKKGGSVAQVSLKLVSAETTEGLARVLNEALKGQGRIPKA